MTEIKIKTGAASVSFDTDAEKMRGGGLTVNNTISKTSTLSSDGRLRGQVRKSLSEKLDAYQQNPDGSENDEIRAILREVMASSPALRDDWEEALNLARGSENNPGKSLKITS